MFKIRRHKSRRGKIFYTLVAKNHGFTKIYGRYKKRASAELVKREVLRRR